VTCLCPTNPTFCDFPPSLIGKAIKKVQKGEVMLIKIFIVMKLSASISIYSYIQYRVLGVYFHLRVGAIFQVTLKMERNLFEIIRQLNYSELVEGKRGP
jgi:hypothetical protein